MIENKFPDHVHDKILILLERSIERRITKNIKSPFIPNAATKTIVTKKYNKHGEAIYKFEIIEGLELSRSTAPKGDYDSVDIFYFDCFLSLTHNEKLSVLVYVDPFNEFGDREYWNVFLQESDFKTTRAYNFTLSKAFFKLQKLAEERNLVPKMDLDELRGWNEISSYWGCSVKTMMKLAKKHRLPIVFIEGNVYSLKSKLSERKKEFYDNEDNFVWKREGKKRYAD